MSLLEDSFQAMEVEWLAARRISETRRIEGWGASWAAMTSEDAELRAAGKWRTGRADFLGVARRARDEVTHSAMLGWLLDAAGHHGLGNRVVAALLTLVDVEHAEDNHFLVRLEVAEQRSRADLVLWGDGVKVVIENKVDAMEHPWQCEFLAEDHPDAERFIFLTPTGRPPTTARPEDVWHSLRWSVIADLLEVALQDTGPAAGRHIAEDYLTTLRKEMP